jgi:hypothetical protein
MIQRKFVEAPVTKRATTFREVRFAAEIGVAGDISTAATTRSVLKVPLLPVH